jgi:hypothetical protein
MADAEKEQYYVSAHEKRLYRDWKDSELKCISILIVSIPIAYLYINSLYIKRELIVMRSPISMLNEAYNTVRLVSNCYSMRAQ